jgi:predicted cupin superfamily sugar epimerase
LTASLTAQDVIRLLDLKPHPEGGHFRETFRDTASTAIYFLLSEGERAHWHRIDAVEVWHWYAGAALAIELFKDGSRVEHVTLSGDFSAGQRPQVIVPAQVWQAAQTLGEWTLCGCTVAPAFDFSGFELAPKDWTP